MENPEGLFDFTGKPLTRMPDVIRPGTSAVIFNDLGEVLLERRSDNGFWGLPGGAVEIGESVEEAIIREVFEETGLRVTVERLIGIYSNPNHYTIASYPDGMLVQHVTTAFVCRRNGGELRISEESTDIGYFDVEAMPENTMLSHSIRVRDALAEQTTPFLK